MNSHRTARRTAALACAALLQACGGGSDVGPQPDFVVPQTELSGRVTNGNDTPGAAVVVSVKGTSGITRITSGSPSPRADSDFQVSLDQLTGPYLLADQSAGVVSVATAPGTANVTPLTSLLVAELLGQDPFAYFDNLLGEQSINLTVDATLLQAADQQVRRYLQRELNFTVPATLGDFVTTGFDRVAGDPMYDTIAALAARAVSGGGYRALAAAVGEEAGRCKLEKVTAAIGGVSDEFCPFSKSNQLEDADATVQALGFTNKHGDALTLRVRGSDVLSAQLLTAENASFRCSGAACAGIVLGTTDGDKTRPIVFDAVALTSADGTARLDGRLTSAVPGAVLPGLPCSTNRYYLIHPDNTAEGYCAGPDDFGIGQGGAGVKTGTNRIAFNFAPMTDQAVYQTVQVVVEGDAVIGVGLRTTDGSSAPYACVGASCAGLVIGPIRIDSSLGIDIQLRSFVLSGVVLQAVLPDGSLSATDTLTLRADLTGAYAPSPDYTVVPCADPAQSVLVQASDAPAPVTVCASPDGSAVSYVDGDKTGFFVRNLLTDGNGTFTSGDSVEVVIASDGSVASASFTDRFQVIYGCTGSACTGVTVSVPNRAGERTVTLAGTLLQETSAFPVLADRTAAAVGSFVAPAPVP